MVDTRDTTGPHGGRRRAAPTARRAPSESADARTDTLARPGTRGTDGREGRTRSPSGARRSSPEDIAASATTSRIPTTPRPRAAHAVFVDGSGRRARRLRWVAVVVAALGALFVTVVAASALAGPSGPVGPVGTPPRAPAPTAATPTPGNAVVEVLPTPSRTSGTGTTAAN